MIFKSFDYYFYVTLDGFIRMNGILYRGVYNEKRDKEFCEQFINEVKIVFKDYENYSTMLSLPEDVVDSARQYLGVYENLEPFNYAAIGRRKGIEPRLIDKQIDHFTHAIKNELFKRLFNRCWGKFFEIEELGKEKNVGIHELQILPKQYKKLRYFNYNTIEDIVSFSVDDFCNSTIPSVYYDVIEQVHLMNYRFLDEIDIAIEELIARDIESKRERLGIQKQKALKKIGIILDSEESLK